MNAMQEKLFLELRQTRDEIENSLKSKQRQNWLRIILEEELQDLNAAIQKFENGSYGQCEISGELIPEDLLKIIPTLRSLKDSEDVESYCKKSVSVSFL
ncbi:hypothetical protein BABA_16467 [Neobacillus bataviensis LMG 21833]|uniref:Uncharacterized protein n=1 Tax=Neobacillus bataviensis LMG 21833 TaxID=1117379 RepID=K6C5E1_9BACI|nr:hypothetical protein [Neobacillus bataviensis]EKN66360.1 hypothetical protein BABA_16467 [Neobacillus bataviensis LMG 21833]